MVIGDSLRGTLAKYVPTWLGNVPGLRNLFSLLWTIALQGDMLREWAWEGQLAAYPGVGTPSALPYIGMSRGLVQGPNESNALFAKRLIAWLTTVQGMGSPVGLVLQVQAYLIGQGSLGAGAYPVVSYVDRAGNMTTANTDQSTTRSIVSWDWDEIDGWTDNVGHKPANTVDSYWSDGWLLIQDPYTHYTGLTDPNWLAAWNSGDQGVDSMCPQAVATALASIVNTWKGAHVYVRCIVWCPSPTAFTPNGTYGNWSANVGGNQTGTRNGAYAYWQDAVGF
jgi:hypothetical protein